MRFYILPLAIIIFAVHLKASSNLNQNECPRIRRPWHELSSTERDLYISGLMEIRKAGNGDMTKDEFIAIASVHEDIFAPVTHKASSYLFWHGYLTWELETRIRNLGGKYSCFGMPYWDFTVESGRELHPSIFSTGLGGDGDPNNFHSVNGYSWKYSTDQYWVPYNCYTSDDEYPICSLKRALRESFLLPTAQEFGEGIMKRPQFTDFAKWYATNSNPFHLFTGSTILTSPAPVTTSYDPIWYLFHSMVQYHQAIWTDCNDYDLIDADDLDDHPEAYKAYCVHGECLSPNKYSPEWVTFDLDDTMHFGGSLKDKEWSYIHKHDLTVRKLYDVAKWGIVYDLGNGDGFYTKSGLKEYCRGKLNDKWFIVHEEEEEQNEQEILGVISGGYHPMYSYKLVFIGVAMLFSLYLLYVACKNQRIYDMQRKMINDQVQHSYGTV